MPAGEHHQRQGYPAASGAHVFRPHRCVGQRQVGPGQPSHCAAEQHGQRAYTQHWQAHGAGRIGIFADRLDNQPDAAFQQRPGDQCKQRKGQVDQQVLGKQHAADQRNVTQQRDGHRFETAQWLADPGGADEAGKADTEDGQRQPGRDLIGVEHQRHQRKQCRQQHASEHRQQHAQP